MNTYAVVDKDNKVLFVHDWDGQVYDAETNPNGWTPPENTTSILLSEKDLQNAESDGDYDATTKKFARSQIVQVQPVQSQQALTEIQQLVQILEDKGLITPEDAVSFLTDEAK